MKSFRLETVIRAPAERCFRLALSVELHLLCGKNTQERVAKGRMSGLLREGETITWEGKHLGMRRQLETMVSAIRFPESFFTRQIRGPFKRLEHVHLFREESGVTVMTDLFLLEAPFGWIGKIAEWLFLRDHMKKYLLQRNEIVRKVAESDLWPHYIKNEDHETFSKSQMA